MRHVTFLIAVVFSLIAANAASAQEPEGDRILLLRQGTPAPFTGYLYTEAAAVEWRQRIQLLEARLELDVRHAEELGRIRLEGAELQLSLIQSEMEWAIRAGQRRWYQHPVFVAVCTAVVTGLVFSTAWRVAR